MKNEEKYLENYRLENAKIEDIGLYYLGHGNMTYIRAVLGGRGWGVAIDIPEKKVGAFINMFKDEVDVENGLFLHELAGKPVRVMFDGPGLSASVIGIGDILSNETDMVMIKE